MQKHYLSREKQLTLPATAALTLITQTVTYVN